MESGVKVEYQPKFGRVLIERELKEAKNGIILPDNAAERNAPCRGIITALGSTAGWTIGYNSEGNEYNLCVLKVGDKVLFGQHAGAWIDKEQKLFICKDEDILCVIN